MTLPFGSYTINSNGIIGLLAINPLSAPDSAGNQFFTGSVTFAKAFSIVGYWDEAGQKIEFILIQDPAYTTFQVFRGNLFSVISGAKVAWTMAGDVNIFSMTANTATWNSLLPPIKQVPGLWCAQGFTSVVTGEESEARLMM